VIVDGFTLLGDSLYPGGVNAAAAIAAMDEAEIDVAVACPVKPRSYDLPSANRAVAEAVARHPTRLVGFARVDPFLGGEACRHLRAAVADGARGLFLHPWEETFRANAPVVDPVIRTASELDIPVLIAAGYPWLSEGLQIGALAGRFPEVTFIATNGAQMNISGFGQVDAELSLSRNANLLITTNGVYREDFLEGVVRRVGAERLVFASGFPAMDPVLERRRVEWSHLKEGEKKRVLGITLARLLELCDA
jgi:predicted TIM-barrel fold metal-dependent hydrolase